MTVKIRKPSLTKRPHDSRNQNPKLNLVESPVIKVAYSNPIVCLSNYRRESLLCLTVQMPAFDDSLDGGSLNALLGNLRFESQAYSSKALCFKMCSPNHGNAHDGASNTIAFSSLKNGLTKDLWSFWSYYQRCGLIRKVVRKSKPANSKKLCGTKHPTCLLWHCVALSAFTKHLFPLDWAVSSGKF